jgi:cytochrome c3-like protein
MRPTFLVIGIVIVGVAAWQVVARMSHLGVQQGYGPAQPIAFSHKLHAGDNKIACLYCHYGARTSRHAGIPAPSVCMNCHSLLEKQTVAIERIKEAVQVERPILAWVKIHNLPDFVYFNHSRHVSKGVACQKCHGAVETMERVQQVAPLTMGWCLDCHREHAGVPTATLKRAALRLSQLPPLATGLDCVSCHY